MCATAGDRIGIMRDGFLRCVGSSLFLKDRFGCGYSLDIVKAVGCDVSAVTHTVHEHIAIATVEDDIGTEIAYKLPKSETGKFAALFTTLESQRDALKIDSFGASVTTMEDVFLRINADAPAAAEHDVQHDACVRVTLWLMWECDLVADVGGVTSVLVVDACMTSFRVGVMCSGKKEDYRDILTAHPCHCCLM